MKQSSAAILIPARYGSTRFPAKPLAVIAGRSLLERTWRIAKAVPGAHEVYIATDDDRLRVHAEGFGAKVIMTSEACRNGTERVIEALETLQEKPEIVINLQGDALLTPPWVLQSLIEEMSNDATVQVATPAVRLSLSQYHEIVESKKSGRPGGTLVVFDSKRNALYFSKAMIPFLRAQSGELPVFRHIGLYSYTRAALRNLGALPPGPLEQAEQLEQLRALEHGIPIRVVIVDYKGRTHWSVDSPEDAEKAAEIIQREGELC